MRQLFLPLVLVLSLLAACAPRADTTAPYALPEDFRQVINNAKAKVFPAVVFIRVVTESYEAGKRTTHEAAGSGVLISSTGEVLTNWHVVDKAVEVRCLLFSGAAYQAKIVGSDKDTDLALVQLTTPSAASSAPSPKTASTSQPSSPTFPFATLGDSAKLHEGDFVMAMGAPWGLSRSVSLGIISCARRYLPELSEYALWLQTDAAISPGNSGGPLVNTDGEVIGINARGTLEGGVLGFAIPSETIAQILPQLRQSGKVEWAFVGLQLQPLRDFNRNVYFEGSEGVIIADTDADSPARRAGIQPRDRLLAINDTNVAGLMEEDLPAIRRVLGLVPKSAPTTLTLLRNSQRLNIQVTPREKGKTEGDSLDCPRWDLTVQAINQFDNPDLFFQRQKGVFIHGIKSPGNASKADLRPDDIILQVDFHDVATLEDIKKIHKDSLAHIDDNPRLTVTVLRNGQMRQIILNIAADYSKE